jgi:hypothetical protein
MNFKPFRVHLEKNQLRPIPAVVPPSIDGTARGLLLESLREFQLGEAGEGKIAHEIDSIAWFDSAEARHHVSFAPTNETEAGAHFKKCVKLWVKEEGRHARILGLMVQSMGGTLRAKHWTAKLFEKARRAFGVSGKLLVALCAEVVGGAFYDLLSKGIADGTFGHVLAELASDEEKHLEFQAAIFRGLTATPLTRILFAVLWTILSGASSLLVYWRHAPTLAAFGITGARFRFELFRRSSDCLKLVLTGPRTADTAQPIPVP